ncbi:MAG: DUF5305 domain-containing protein, partial [Anaerolineae bacterium]|nr:DUF5305 domain-containing protein [Anaerolineae bacterium]
STSFVGPSFDVSSVIEFQKIQKFVDNFEARTGIQRGQYILSIKPYVSVEGKFGKENLIDQYAPMLNFRFDELQIQLVNDNPADENVLRPSQGGVVPQYTQEDNTISILNSEITVLAARWVSILGVALSIGAILYFSLLVKESERQGEAAKIALLYSAWVVPVSHFKESSKPIEVQEFSELIKLAESCGKLIFHEVRGDAHHYYLQDDQGIFHYQALPFVDRGEPRDPFIGRLVGKTKEFLSLGYSKIRKGSAPDQAEND